MSRSLFGLWGVLVSSMHMQDGLVFIPEGGCEGGCAPGGCMEA